MFKVCARFIVMIRFLLHYNKEKCIFFLCIYIQSAIESVVFFLAIGLLSYQFTNVTAQGGFSPAAANALGAAAGGFVRGAGLGQGFGGQGFRGQGFGGQGFGNQFGGSGFGNQIGGPGYYRGGGYGGSPYSGGLYFCFI